VREKRLNELIFRVEIFNPEFQIVKLGKFQNYSGVFLDFIITKK